MKRNSILKTISVLALAAVLIMGLGACGSSESGDAQPATTEAAIEVTTELTEESIAEAADEAMESMAAAESEEAAENEALESAFTDIQDTTGSDIQDFIMISRDGDDVKEYQHVFYAAGVQNILKAIHVETHFYKSAGYTEDQISQIDIEQLYPGIKALPFVETSYSDEGDYYTFIIKYNELDDPDHLDQLYDCGCKLEARRGTGMILGSDSYKELLLAQGAVEVTDAELHSTFEE